MNEIGTQMSTRPLTDDPKNFEAVTPKMRDPSLPPSLAATPNIPVSKQTLPQLEAELAYWEATLDAKKSWGAASAAIGEFIRECKTWITIRRREKPKRKIYVASPFAIQADASRFGAQLVHRGHTITSGWLQAQLVDMGDAEASRVAADRDIIDVLAADTVVVLTDPRPIGAGHHVEYGGAIFTRYLRHIIERPPIHCIVAGPIKSIFHWLADEVYESPEKALERSPWL